MLTAVLTRCLAKAGQRPVTHAGEAARAVQQEVGVQRAAVDRIAGQRQPLVVSRDDVEGVAVRDQQAAASAVS